MLRTVAFDCRPDPVTGISKDTVVLQFADNTGVWSNNIYLDTASLCAPQRGIASVAHPFRHNVAGLGQHVRRKQWPSPIPQIGGPPRLINAPPRSRQRGRALDKLTLVDEGSSKGRPSRRDLLALTRGLPEPAKKQLIIVPQRQLSDERSCLPHNMEMDAEIDLSEPFGPYDVIKSKDSKKTEEPFYHILEEQPEEERSSQPTGRRADPFVHIYPLNPSSDEARGASHSPHLRPPLKAPGDESDTKDALSARECVDYEDIDDESIYNPEAPAGASWNGAKSPNKVCAAVPFKPWPGCPEKVLLLHPSSGRTIVKQEDHGSNATTKSKLDQLYAKVRKVERKANYRPVVKVPCERKSQFEVFYDDLSSDLGRKAPTAESPASRAQACTHEGSDFTRKQKTCNSNRVSDYDHISKQSVQTRDVPGGGIYNRCRPEEDRKPGAKATDQSTREMQIKQEGNEGAERNQALCEGSLSSEMKVVEDDGSSEATIFYDRLKRPNFKGAKPKRSQKTPYGYESVD